MYDVMDVRTFLICVSPYDSVWNSNVVFSPTASLTLWRPLLPIEWYYSIVVDSTVYIWYYCNFNNITIVFTLVILRIMIPTKYMSEERH